MSNRFELKFNVKPSTNNIKKKASSISISIGISSISQDAEDKEHKFGNNETTRKEAMRKKKEKKFDCFVIRIERDREPTGVPLLKQT